MKNRATIWPWNPTLGHISGEKHDLKGSKHPNVLCITVCNSQDRGMAIDRGMDKDVVFIYNRILLSYWKEWKNAICS